MTKHQILDELKSSVTDVKVVDQTSNTIKNFNEAKDITERKLSSIDFCFKLTMKAVCNAGECLRATKKLFKVSDIQFGEFLSEVEIKKVKMKTKTADRYIRIYKL